jgi:D-alanine-D-alanine ligase/UDP-N-acetylmuramate--alanine ligase
MKVVIVHGGVSTEEAVSTRNALYVEGILSRLGYETELVLYDYAMPEKLRLVAPDVVFVCVQGKGHGDGTIQAMLDFFKIPYTGTKTLGAAIINNKIISKELFERAGIPTPPWQSLSAADYRAGNFDFSRIGFPVVAKAPTQGGSYGIELIKSAEDIPKIESVLAYDDPILIEKFICGRFVTLGLLRRNGVLETFPPVEKESDPPTPKTELVLVNSRFIFKPSDLPDRAKTEVDAIGRRVFAVSRAKDYARIDFMISETDGRPYVLEINAVPGLKHGSLYPYGAGLRGFKDEEVIETILRNAGSGEAGCSET